MTRMPTAEDAHALLGALVAQIPEAVVTVDGEGHILSFSTAAERMFGHSAAEAVGKSVGILMPVADRETHARLMNDYRKSGDSAVLGKAGRRMRGLRTDGSEFDLEMTVTAVRGPPDPLYLGVISDVTERVAQQRRLIESDTKVRSLFELSPLGILRHTLDGHYLDSNQALLDILGYTAEEMQGLCCHDLTPAKYAAEEKRQFEQLRATGSYGPFERECIHRSGRLVPIQMSGCLITGSDGQSYALAVVEDISARRAAAAAKEATEARLTALVNSLPVTLAVLDRDENCTLFRSDSSARQGWQGRIAIGRNIGTTLQDQPEILGLCRRALAGESLAITQWIGDLAQEIHLAPMLGASGEILGAVAIALDVTEREQNVSALHSLANLDELTGLPNRHAFRARLTEGIIFAEEADTKCAVLVIDMDHFKRVNGTRGNEAGDHLLIKIGARLAGLVGEGEVAARLNGDEFAILLTGLPSRTAQRRVLEMSRRIAEALKDPFECENGTCQLTASIGIAIGAQEDGTPDQLLRRADTALHAAKEAGRGQARLFDPAMDRRIQELVEIDTQLRGALERNELSLVYQPIVDTADGRIVKVETLLRWTNGELGSVPPDRFIPIAEENGEIVPIGAWILRQAAADMVSREKNGGAPIAVSVNVSARQMADPDFLQHVQAALAGTGLPAQRLELELTERLLVTDDGPTRDNIERLRALGVAFSVDDFGVGYSSFAYLTRLPLQSIKIDRSFVDGVEHNLPNRETIRAILALARSLGMQVVCEGVETAAAASLLRDIGCRLQQGYFHGRPCPKAEIREDKRASATGPVALRPPPQGSPAAHAAGTR